MDILTGTIEEIREMKGPYKKKELALSMQGNQKAFIQFTNPTILKRLEEFSTNEKVQVVVVFKGSISKSGIHFNNLIATTIKKLNRKLSL